MRLRWRKPQRQQGGDLLFVLILFFGELGIGGENLPQVARDLCLTVRMFSAN